MKTKHKAAQHTPAPWRVNKYDGGRMEIIDADGNPACIKQNARLIAAAPELLAELSDICAHAVANDRGGFDIAPSYIRAARAAIAKVKGI